MCLAVSALKILEVGRYAAGYCGRLFARRGARVSRVELSPPRPAWVGQQAMNLFLHENKRKLKIDPTELACIATQVDLVICETDTASHLEALGYHQWNASLKVAITPFGLTGPHRNRRATTSTLSAMAGHTHLVGAPGREPLTVAGHYIDFQAGALAYAAANAHRIAGAKTQIDISLLETAATHHYWTHTRLHTLGDIRGRHDSDYWYCVPGHLYPCMDGFVYITINDNFWETFTLMLDRPELIIDERFSDNQGRMQNRGALHAIVKSKFMRYTRDELEALAAEFRFPLGALRSEQEVLDDAHLAARNFWERSALPGGREVLIPGSPVRVEYTETNRQPDRASARRGEYSRAMPPLPETVHRPNRPFTQFQHEPEAHRDCSGLRTGAAQERDDRLDGPSPPGDRFGMTTSAVEGPLGGIRVLDLTHVWAGPLAVRYLADFGATVVKVEAADSRAPRPMNNPPTGGWLGENATDEPWNRDAGWIILHRNRFGLCLDLKSARGREVFLQLVKVSDIVVENFSARTMENLGLSYPVLAEANPGIIYVTMPGYGSDGPYRDRVAFGTVVECQAGMNARLGYGPDNLVNTTQAMPDPISAHHALGAIIDALEVHKIHGAGARIEVSLHEAAVTATGPTLLEHQLTSLGEVSANRHPNAAPHGIYRCSGEDQWLALACENDEQWRSLCAVLRNDHYDMDYRTRQKCHDAIDSLITRWTRNREKNKAAAILQDAGVPAGPIYTSREVEADEQLRSREFFGFTDRFGVPMQGNPVHAEDLDWSQWQAAPRLGEHNTDILSTWLGYDEQQIAELQSVGVIATEPPG